MILQSLMAYYEALEKKGLVQRPGWCQAKVSHVLELSEDGELKRVIPLKEEQKTGKKTVMVSKILKVPEMVSRASGIAANFLCDNSTYFLGIDKKGKPERSRDCFRATAALHHLVLDQAEGMAARAVLRFFDTWNPETAMDCPVLQPELDEILKGGNLVFEVDGDYPQEISGIQEAWEAYREQGQAGTTGICLVTGKRGEIARTHNAIRGIPGAQASGAMLVSFNAPAFESYCKVQSYNAPVGTYAVYAYTTALNWLVADKKHASRMGDMMVVYWSEDGEQAYQDVFWDALEPSVDNFELIDGVFKNLEQNKAIDVEDVEEKLSLDQRFFILGLSPNAARVSVRFFYQDSFGNVLKNLKAHYDRMEIIKPSFDHRKYLGVFSMLLETANTKAKEIKPAPNLAGAVYQAILANSRYPYALYQAVIGRIRAEKKVTRGKAAIIKAFLLQNGSYDKKEVTMALNDECSNAAYILGREFSVLEAVQEDANPGINATIKDRYFNSACATPASIFPILFKLKNSHIRKLPRKSAVYYEKLLQHLQDKLETGYDGTAIPKRLTLEEQGMFILGYYHQTQNRYDKKNKEEADNGRSDQEQI